MLIPIIDCKEMLECPKEIGHHYTPLYAFNLEDLAEFSDHNRMQVFFFKGLTCVNPFCNREAKYLIMGQDKFGSTHIDLYDKDFILMTVDHVHPVSKKGGEELSNKQPMCCKCNSRKSNHLNYSFKESETNHKKCKRAKKRDRILNKNIEAFNVSIGDEIYSVISMKFLGKIIDIRINERDPLKRMSAVTTEKGKESFYLLSKVFKK